MTDTNDNTDTGSDIVSDETGLNEALESNSYDETPAEDIVDVAKKPRRKYGKFALGLTALSALVIGGASGGGFVKYLMPASSANAPVQNVDLGPLTTQITQLKNKNAKLETQLSNMSASFKTLQGSVKNIKVPDVKAVDLSGLKSRLDALENAPKPAPLDEAMLARLEKLQADGSPALDLSAFEARLSELETAASSGAMPEGAKESLQELYDQYVESEEKIEAKIAALSQDLTEMQTRLDALSDIQLTQSKAALQSSSVSGQAAASAFPKQALLDAVTAQTTDKPFLKRALSKHIKVKDPSSPAGIIDAITADLAEGNIEGAAARFDSLPSHIRSAGQAWRDSLNQ